MPGLWGEEGKSPNVALTKLTSNHDKLKEIVLSCSFPSAAPYKPARLWGPVIATRFFAFRGEGG